LSSGTKQYNNFDEGAIKATPQLRLGTTHETATLILFLASTKASSFVTGQIYYIDGGQSLTGPVISVTEAIPTKARNPKL